MDVNVIKEFLVGIGFKVDNESFNQAQQTMNNAEHTVKNFANNNKDTISSMQKFFQAFNGSLKDNIGMVSSIVPEAKNPLLQLLNFTGLLYNSIDKVSKNFNNIKTDKLKESQDETKKASDTMTEFSSKAEQAQSPIIQLIALVRELNAGVDKLSSNIQKLNFSNLSKDISKSKNTNLDNVPSKANIPKFNKINLKNKPLELPKLDNENKLPIQLPSNSSSLINKTTEAIKGLSSESGNASKALVEFAGEGAGAIEEFSVEAISFLGPVGKAAAALIIVSVTAWKTLTSLANQDIGYQKLAMQMWTTRENAREISMALSTMKVSMQDLWLSPELLQQFNQLRRDSAQLKLPNDYEDKLKLVRSIGYEFQRLQQAGTLAFQWIGYYISKYAAGPLADIHQALNKFTDGLLKNIPSIAKVIGTVLGVIFRLVLDLVKIIGILTIPVIELWKIIGKLFTFVKDGLDALPAPIKNIIKLIGLIAVILAMPILAIDDLFTAIRGGHSVIGDFFNYFKEKAAPITNIFKNLIAILNSLKSKIKEAEAPFISFGKNVQSIFASIAKFITTYIINPIEYVIKKIEDFIAPIKNAIKDVKELPGNIGGKINNFANQYTPNYITPSTTSIKNTNSNATQNNKTNNTFNIYGTDPKSTANAINNKINTGINTRNLQGIF